MALSWTSIATIQKLVLVTQQYRMWWGRKTVTEEVVCNCVPFCLKSFIPLDRCGSGLFWRTGSFSIRISQSPCHFFWKWPWPMVGFLLQHAMFWTLNFNLYDFLFFTYYLFLYSYKIKTPSHLSMEIMKWSFVIFTLLIHYHISIIQEASYPLFS